MKIKYFLGILFLSHYMNAGIKETFQKAFTYSKDMLASLTNAIDLTPTGILKNGIQTGFQIHSAITGHNPLYDLTMLTAQDFTPSSSSGNPRQSVINAYNTNINTVATVRTTPELSQQEEQFVENRLPHAQKVFEQLCAAYQVDYNNSRMPRVALCASGGGCRAMIATLGFYKALEDINVTMQEEGKNTTGSLLDVALYAAALSGSTWTTIPRALGISHDRLLATFKKYVQFNPENLGFAASNTNKPVVDLTPELQQDGIFTVDSNDFLSSSLTANNFTDLNQKLSQTQRNYLIPQSQASEDNLYDERSFIYKNILRSFYADTHLSGMDIYGILLSHMAAAAFDDPLIDQSDAVNSSSSYYCQPRQRIFYSQAAAYLESTTHGAFPLPLAAAVAPKKIDNSWMGSIKNLVNVVSSSDLIDDFQWFEFSPYEIGTVYNARDGYHGAFVPTWAFGRKFKKLNKTVTTQEWVTKEIHYAQQVQNHNYRAPSSTQIRRIDEPVTKVVSTSLESDSLTTYQGSKIYASEYPLGNLLGIFGSAFAFSPADYLRITGMTDSLPNYPYMNKVISSLSKLMNNDFTFTGSLISKYHNFRLFPFTTNNFMQFVSNSPCPDKDLVLVDAGLDFNLPFPLLLRKERAVDVIIAMDASSPIFTVDSRGNKIVDALVGAEKWAKKHKIPFPKIAGAEQYTRITSVDDDGRVSQNIFIFKGDDETPTLVYIPLLDNPANQGSNFNVADCMQNQCNTFNFGYSQDTIQGLYKHVYNTINNHDTIEQILTAIAQKA